VLFALAALLPLRLGLEWLSLADRGFAAREARGSLWFGALSEARWGPLELGDLQAGLRTLPLLAGRARVDLERGDDGQPFEASITVSRHGFGIDDAAGILPVGGMLAPLPLASLQLDDVTAHFADGRCVQAEGRVKADLAGAMAGLPLPPSVAGNLRCDGGALLVPLTSQGGMEAVNLRLREDGRYTLELVVRPSDERLRAGLIASGFRSVGDGYLFSVSGRF
jgi:general secretion pathway protein N